MLSKRIVSLFLAGVTVCSLASCSGGGGTTTVTSDPSSVLTTMGTDGNTLTPILTPTPSVVPDDSENKETEDKVVLSKEDIELYENSYNILYDRITDRGYAITSLTGTYVGMFTRDSAIQAMAHLGYGDSDSARSILRYLLSYHTVLGLRRGTHIIDNIKDEEYRNNYLSSGNDNSGDYYEEQLSPGKAQFLINAPNNASATPFTTKKRSIDMVQAYLEGAVGAEVVAEIYTDLTNPDTIVGRGSYKFESSAAGWKKITLDSAVSLDPDKTYYLKLYAPSGSGRIVWYGVENGAPVAKKAWNYDMSAYGGNGWREVGVYTAFVIGESDTEVTEKYSISQKNGETALYIINAPNNKAAQGFIPKNDTIKSVAVHLTKTGNGDTVEAFICKDYKDTSAALGKAAYTFGTNESGWQNIVFDEAVKVVPGEKYYLVLQATEKSGKVVWNGTTGSADSSNSYNYDKNAFGGWEEKPYHPAFEIYSYSNTTVAKGFEARGNTASGVELNVFTASIGGEIIVELRKDYADENTVIATAKKDITQKGSWVCKLDFGKEIGVDYKGYYYLVVTFKDTKGASWVITDTASAADTHSFEGNWERIGYDLLADVIFNVDKTPIVTLDGQTKGIQEIPTKGEIITSLKVLLSKDSGAAGKVKATLYKGNGSTAQLIDAKVLDVAQIKENADWITIKFDLPLAKINSAGNYYLHLEGVDLSGNVHWCGSDTIDNYETVIEKNGNKTAVKGEAGFEALRSEVKLISDYTQTDANYMLIHAWVMYVNNNKGTSEDIEFIEQSYPIIKGFANYYIDNPQYYNKTMNLLLNPSLEHSRKIRYWKSYDLLTNVFASQALYELSSVAKTMKDETSAEKWMKYAKQIEDGINTHLVTEYDGKRIYGEFYDVEDNMKFYAGISWVNLAPVAAEWYGMDMEIMKNTYDVYKKYASVKMYGTDCLATEATLGTNELTRELIGKGLAWELMFCEMIGDNERIAQLVALERATAKRNNISVYPEFWKSETYVTDPGNQEHCSWQCYAMTKVFPELCKGE